MTCYTYNAQQMNQMQQAQLRAADLQQQCNTTIDNRGIFGSTLPGEMKLYNPPDPYTQRAARSTYVDYIYMTENVFRRMESMGMKLSASKERNVCAAISYITRKGEPR